MLTPQTLAITAVALLLFASCKKDGKKKEQLFHKDIVIREQIRGGEQAQNTLLLQSPTTDPSILVSVASRGVYENEAEGFRIMQLKKDKGVVLSKSFTVPLTYYYQFATCAAMDKTNFVWVAGHVFGGDNSFGKPFVVKLSPQGDVLFSKIYPVLDEHDSPITFRAGGIIALANGEALLVAHSSSGFQLVRLSGEGNIVWKVLVPNNWPDPDFLAGINLGTTTNVATELSDGSIVLHAFRNNVSKKDYLIKIDAQGSLVFAKRYTYEANYTTSPSQLIALPDNKILLAGQKRGSVSGFPYAFILSANGEVLKAKGSAINAPVNNPFEINEAKYIDGKILLTTTGGYEFAHYYLDMDLSVTSSKKMLQSNIIYVDRGGLSAWDAATKTVYHVIDVSGQAGEGNGFQFVRSSASGESCHGYTSVPEPLVLNNITVLAENEPSIIVKPAYTMTAVNFNWNVANFSIESEDKMCVN